MNNKTRISRYQASLNNYIKKSCVYNIQNDLDKLISEILDRNSDNIVPIILLTILNSQCKKNNLSLHGYFIATSIELIVLLCKIMDNNTYFQQEYQIKHHMITNITNKIQVYINKCVAQNINYISSHIDKERLSMLCLTVNEVINENIFEIINHHDFMYDEVSYDSYINKTDLTKFTFSDKKIVKSLKKIKKIKKEYFLKYIQIKYGNLGYLILYFSWIFGLNIENINNIKNNFKTQKGNIITDKNNIILRKLGIVLGNLIKILNDFENVERDIKYSNGYCYNYVVNFGIQEAFEFFVINKTKFIEGCISNDIYTNTIKEVIDHMERKVDIFLNNVSLDLKTEYTLT